MIKASYKQYILQFKRASATSRGVLNNKQTWFLTLLQGNKKGVGECGLFRGLSADDRPDYSEKLIWVCKHINLGKNKLLDELVEFPSIQFGLEQAFLSLSSSNPHHLFPSLFTQGKKAIPTNGLIWMGDKKFMQRQIKEKLQQGFTTLKIKIGAINFETELALLKAVRDEFSADEIALRVDANGAFNPANALEKLKRLSELQLHSIEQPIKQGQWQEMAQLCELSPLPIALDEELIGIYLKEEKQKCIETINPQFIILKPSLIGGYKASEQWIKMATNKHIGYWITSALESNIGLNAIAQWTQTLNNSIAQGLGTGTLFTNNIKSPLELKNGSLHYSSSKKWDFNF
ncbi:MAG: o-succinylbenzoate synthase [Tenacibaculum sp.]